MLNNILAVAWKELQLIVRDRGALAIFFLLPLLLSTIQGGANAVAESEEGATAILLNVQLVNEDSGDFGREVMRAIENIDELAIETPSTVGDAEEAVRQGDAAAAILIPANFSANINAYEPTEIEVIVDPAEPESASIVTGIMNHVVAEVTIWGEVQYGIRSVFGQSGLLGDLSDEQRRGIEVQNLGVIMTSLNELREDPLITVVNESLQGEKVDEGFNKFFAYMYPAYTVMFIFFVIGTCAESILKEREVGTLRRLVEEKLPKPVYPAAPQAYDVQLGDGVHAAWRAYARAMIRDILTSPEAPDKRLWGVYGRLPSQAFKVAVILAALDWAEGDGAPVPVVSLSHWARGQTIAETWRASAHRLLGSLSNRRVVEEHNKEDRILQMILAAGTEGITARSSTMCTSPI